MTLEVSNNMGDENVNPFFKSRPSPIVISMLIGSVTTMIYLYFWFYSGNAHLRKAQDNFDRGRFGTAVIEAQKCLDDEPQNQKALVILADAHSELAMQSRSDGDKFKKHVCAAIAAYKKSLSISFNNNVNSKMVRLEELTGEIFYSISTDGTVQGGCGEKGN